VTRSIHNFGQADQVERQELVQLYRSIDSVCVLTISDPLEYVGKGQGIISGDLWYFIPAEVEVLLFWISLNW
jgi:hypothetical protein